MDFRARPDGGLYQDDGFQPARPDQSAAQRLVKRIATALNVPASALYRPPNAIDGLLPSKAASSPAGASPFESRELLTAFHSLRDPEDRRRALEFVRGAAERG